MKANIKNGIRYTFTVSPGYGGCFYASVSKAAKHTYGKRTAFGERTRWKVFSYFQVKGSDGSLRFPSGAAARAAAKEFIAQKMAGK